MSPSVDKHLSELILPQLSVTPASVNIVCLVFHVSNNNNKGSRGMGEVAPLYGVDPALVLTNPGVQ